MRQAISNPELDRIYDVATTIGGAEAGKILGAGGGGFFLFWAEDKKKLKEALADYQELPFIIDKYGSRIVINLEGPFMVEAFYRGIRGCLIEIDSDIVNKVISSMETKVSGC